MLEKQVNLGRKEGGHVLALQVGYASGDHVWYQIRTDKPEEVRALIAQSIIARTIATVSTPEASWFISFADFVYANLE